MKEKKEYQIFKDPKIRQRIREQLEGFKIMNEFVHEEQRRNLPKMTPEESMKIYEDLRLIWEHSKKQNPDMGDLEQRRIKELIARRNLFNKIAAGLSKKC